MRKPLVRSLKATLDVDPVLDDCDAEIEAARSLLSSDECKDQDKVREALAELEAERERYLAQGARPVVRVRVIPPQPLASIRLGLMRNPMEKGKDNLERLLWLNRELARWAVVGWDLQFDGEPTVFETVELDHDGRCYNVASDESIDVLESAGYLGAVAMAAWRFNVLQEDDRKK